MGVRHLSSHAESLALSWIFFAFITAGVVLCITKTLSQAQRGAPRAFSVWVFICTLVLSPARYAFLMAVVAVAYPVQSPTAFVSFLILVVYMPVIFVLLCVVGIGLPVVTVANIAGRQEPPSRSRLYLAAAATPVLMLLGSGLYFYFLPLAAQATHWLQVRNVIRATNGPAEYVYRFLVEPGIPLQMPEFVQRMGPDHLGPTERLRAHFAKVYLSPTRLGFYKTGRSRYYLTRSIRNLERAAPFLGPGAESCDAEPEFRETVIRFQQRALAQARLVDIEELNGWFHQLGDRYRDNLTIGLEYLLRGYADSDATACATGWRLLSEWSDWSATHLEEIDAPGWAPPRNKPEADLRDHPAQ